MLAIISFLNGKKITETFGNRDAMHQFVQEEEQRLNTKMLYIIIQDDKWTPLEIV